MKWNNVPHVCQSAPAYPKCFKCSYLVKVKVFYGQEPPVENLLPQNMGSIINYLQ